MTDRELKNIFLVSGIFSGKVYSAMLVGLRMYYKLAKFNQIVGAIFDKMKILIFSSCELPLILGVGEKTKKRLEIIT